MPIVTQALQFLVILALTIAGSSGSIWDQRNSKVARKVDKIELPDQFTEHALTKHVDEAWNAVSISRAVTAKTCGPIVAYSCNMARVKVLCKLNEEQTAKAGFGSTRNGWWAGVVIAKISGLPKITSAFAASWDYWEGDLKRNACVPIAWVP